MTLYIPVTITVVITLVLLALLGIAIDRSARE
jgi:hypothetical protein